MRKFWKRFKENLSYGKNNKGSVIYALKVIREFVYSIFDIINEYISISYQKYTDKHGGGDDN